jgi:hypothetical protein
VLHYSRLAGDLAIQVSYRELKKSIDRPTAKELITLMAPLQPHRGAAAHLLWHYYRYLECNSKHRVMRLPNINILRSSILAPINSCAYLNKVWA